MLLILPLAELEIGVSFFSWMDVEWWQTAFYTYLRAAVTSSEQVISAKQFSKVVSLKRLYILSMYSWNEVDMKLGVSEKHLTNPLQIHV